MSGGWLLPEREHTFKGTGRTAIVRDAPNVYAIFSSEELAPHLDAYNQGAIEDPAINLMVFEAIVRHRMVRPRIAERDEPLPEDDDPENPTVVPYGAMDTSEIEELVTEWGEAVARSARFRENGARAGGGAGGKGVGTKPKRAPRASAGKS